MTQLLHSLFFLLGAPALVCAQSMTISAASSATLSASLGGGQQNVSVPMGPLPAQGSSAASTGNAAGDVAVAEVHWSALAGPYSLEIFLTGEAYVSGATPGQASGGPHDFLITVSSPTPTVISFELTRAIAGTPGNAIPVTRVDVRDDGVFELDETTPSVISVTEIVGPTPLLIRCAIGASVTGIGTVVSSLHLIGTPAQTPSVGLLPGCNGGGYSVAARFDGNLDYWVSVMHPGVAVAVFGLVSQPLYLGSQSPGPFSPVLPCVLLPRPDFVAVLPTLAPQTLVIPPAARPIEFYSQSVQIDAAGLSTSTAYLTYAY
ncbi:MAG TPA: hypothetical protein VFZ65_07640 [Planctomycetota bacterium]|nr:hypothetical protein [Planctomycetota bacterium]